MSAAIVDQLIHKLGLRNEPRIKDKTCELLRLLELKAGTNAIGDYAKIIICIDIASAGFGLLFNEDDAIKYSGLRLTSYRSSKRTFEKLLDLNKEIGIDYICVSLDLNEISKKANQLLESFKRTICNDGKSSVLVDINHPQYAAMAVYQACKLAKKRIQKSKLMTFSNLKPLQWSKLEKQWDTLLGKMNTSKGLGENNEKSKLESITENPKCNKETKEQNLKNKQLYNEIENYESWKNRILRKALTEYAKEKNVKFPNLSENCLPKKDEILKIISFESELNCVQ